MEIHVARAGQSLGKFPLAEVRRRFASGTFLPTDLVWAEGLPGWVPLVALPGFAPSGAGVPPPPPAVSMGSPSGPVRVDPVSGGAAYVPSQASSLAVVSLVCGIVSIIACCTNGLLGIPAVICGWIALRQIRNSGGKLTGDGMAIAGLVTGCLGIGIGIFTLYNIELRSAAGEPQALEKAKVIMAACNAYAHDHENAYPTTLVDLVPKYLPNDDALTCPLSSSEKIGYYYFGGTNQAPANKVVLMSKYKSWTGRRILARVDGSASIEAPPATLLPPPDQ